MKYFKHIPVSAFIMISCTGINNQKEKSGEELSKTYCGSCHLFPEPYLLDKKTWKAEVLPSMAKQLGIDNIFETALPNQKPVINIKEWKAILNYYINTAPAIMPAQERPVVKELSDLFTASKILVQKGSIPSTSFIKIDEGNHWIYAANSFDSSLNIYNARLNLLSSSKVNAAIVDINFNNSLLLSGQRTGTLTNIGMMNPNDQLTGSADSFSFDGKANLTHLAEIFDSVARPVQITKYDLDSDGKQDYLVCSFGNKKGALYWMKGKVDGRFDKQMLSQLPGALRSYIDDFNGDSLPDIMVLMAQAREGIVLFLNKGNGTFESRESLGFPPIYGSSYFELVDFDKDGYKDLLYTCGDNDDYSSNTLKYYHGVYIYLNDGKNNFLQKYFFPIHGCYKAIAKDFDKDGDLDIAAISFFPDTKNQPQESFVYLEQTTAFHFAPFTVNAFDEGRWMTMDAGDLDGDGYEDIVLGGLIPPIPGKIREWKNRERHKAAVLLLHNEGKNLK